MGVTFLVFLTLIYVIITLVGGFLDQSVAADTPLNNLMQFELFRYSELRLGFVHMKMPFPNVQYISDFARTLTWDYSFFQGDANLVRVILLPPLAVATIFILITQVFPRMLDAIAAIRRSIFG